MKINTARLARRSLAVTALAAALALAGCSDSPESMLGKAKESIAKKDPKAAEIHLKNLLQKSDNAEARFLLGEIHMQGGDLPAADKELRRAEAAGYDASRVAVLLSETLLRMGSAKEALAAAAKGTPADPAEKASLSTTVGRAKLLMGDRNGAKAAYEEAVAANPDHAPALAGLIGLQAAAGEVREANEAADRLVAKHPRSHDALTLKGELELVQGRRNEATEWFVKAALADPFDRMSRARIASVAIDRKDYVEAQKWLDELKKLTGPAPLTMQLQGILYARQGKFNEARDAIQLALKAAPDFIPALALGSEVSLQLGAVEQAERYARDVIERAPNSPQGYRLLAAIQIRTNAPEKALQTLDPVLAKGAKDPVLFALAGEAALRANEPARSAAYFEKGIKLDPADVRKQTGLAYAHLAVGEKDRAMSELARISTLPGADAQPDLALIATLMRDRQYDKALEAIDRLEKKQPGSAMVSNLRGSALLAKGDVAGARKAFEQTIERDPKSVSAVGSLANLDLRDGKPDEAKRRFTTLLERDPKNIQGMLALAQIVLRSAPKGDTRHRDEVQSLLKKAYEADRSSVPAILALASWYAGNNQVKDAIPMLQGALASRPDDIQLLDALGNAYLRADQEALGMETLEKILRARPNDATLQMRMGQMKLARGDGSAALTNFRRAAELQPKAVEPRVAIASALVRTGKTAEARAVATALQKEQPRNAAGAGLEGDILMSERKFDEAANAYRKALSIDSSMPIRIKLHQATLGGKHQSEADAMLRGMIKDAPTHLGLRAYAGDQELGRGRWAEAIGHYEAIVTKQPSNAIALNNMAWAMYELKDPKALETAEKALAAAPKSPAVMDTLGVILVAGGDKDRGLKLLRQAVAEAPKQPALRLHLAEALVKTGDKSGAKSELETVLKDVPQGPIAERARQVLGQL